MKITKVNKIKGIVHPPGDKSISHRVALISALSDGENTIENFLFADDTNKRLSVSKNSALKLKSGEN
jgi:3-phosphoshikimate 1-carboxyvinyltransferase